LVLRRTSAIVIVGVKTGVLRKHLEKRTSPEVLSGPSSAGIKKKEIEKRVTARFLHKNQQKSKKGNPGAGYNRKRPDFKIIRPKPAFINNPLF